MASSNKRTEPQQRRSQKFGRWHWVLLRVVIAGMGMLVGLDGKVEARAKPGKQEVSFRLYNGNLVVVNATIGTTKNVNVILDTGTSSTIIARKLADRLNLHGQTESLSMLSGTIRTESVVLPNIQIGPISKDSAHAVVQDLSFFENQLGVRLGGIAGLDLLRAQNFTLDYERRKIIFGDLTKFEKTVRFETQNPLLTVRAQVNGLEIRLLVDSGTPGLFVYRDCPAAAKLDSRFEESSFSIGGKASRVRWIRVIVSLGDDSLGLQNVTVADEDADPQNGFDGLLGFVRMGFRRVSFDFENGLLGWD